MNLNFILELLFEMLARNQLLKYFQLGLSLLPVVRSVGLVMRSAMFFRCLKNFISEYPFRLCKISRIVEMEIEVH